MDGRPTNERDVRNKRAFREFPSAAGAIKPAGQSGRRIRREGKGEEVGQVVWKTQVKY